MKPIRLVISSLLITICCVIPAFGAEFSDVQPGDWFEPYVEVCAQEGLLNGVGEGKFNPQGVLNGDEALVMAARVLLRANVETQFPEGPDPQGFWDWAGPVKGPRFGFGELGSVQLREQTEAWSWDALFYLAKETGPEIFSEGVDYPADRYTFFRALALAARGMDLPAVNHISAVPGTRDEGILGLYRAGILSGADGSGNFAGQRHLTRAEAAAALARIARPELRVRFRPEPSPYQGYTLTPLTETNSRYHLGLTYPVAAVSRYDEADRQQTVLVTREGKFADFPEGNIYSSGVDRSGDYARFYVVDDQWNAKTWLMDKEGRFVPGSGEYEALYAAEDGHFLGCNYFYDTERGRARWYLLSPGGAVEAELPEIPAGSVNSWHGLNQGVCPWMDETTKLWGYVDAGGEWVADPVWTGAEPFSGGYCVVYNDKGQHIVMDRGWNPVMPLSAAMEEYATFSLPRSSPGQEERGLIYWENWRMDTGLMSPDGKTVYPLPDTVSSPVQYYNGYAAVYDEADGGYYYLDGTARRVSETFDWCGDVSPEGWSLVGMDGKVWRIQFEKR